MDTSDFLRRVTGTAGFYCLFAINGTKRVQKFYKRVEDLTAACENFDEEDWDVYFALGRFNSDKSRTADNVCEMRALFLDLDCGPGKDYPDQPTALQALRIFVKQVGLPKPLVVSSGRGLHAYWPLSAPVPVETWVPVATRLKAACVTLGLRADPAVTADAARVLRVPGTRNLKEDQPKPVMVVHEGAPTDIGLLDSLLSPHAKNAVIPKSAGLFGDTPMPKLSAAVAAAAAGHDTMRALMGSTESSFKKIAAKSSGTGNGCAQIGQMLADPASVSEPLWRAGLSIAAHCKEKSAIHWLSQGHPDYDPDATEAKAARTKGPYLCTTFDANNPGVCGECPLWGKIRSPIVIGKILIEADPETVHEPRKLRDDPETPAPKLDEIPAYPKPYKRAHGGGVYLEFKDDDGQIAQQVVCRTDIYVVRRLTDPEMGEVLEMRYHLPRDGIRTFVVPLYNVTSKEEFRKALAMQGVVANNKEMDLLMAYTQVWVKHLQDTTSADDAHRQFGWIGEFKGFVWGDHVITATDIEHNAPSASTRMLMDHFTPKGTLEGWKEAMNFYNRPGFELHQWVVCAGFGSVLMKFMPINAALIHLWSKDSGFGKTTVQHAALSAWGNPAKLILTEKDTYNSKMNRADVMHSLPVCMDEITNIRPADASDLIYQITGGQQRNRMSSNGNTERYRGDPWNLLFLSSGNCSLIDKVAIAKAMPKAEAQRVLEVEVSRLFRQKEDKEITDDFSRKLQDNFGHAGPPFVQYVMQNREQVDLMLTTVQRQIDRQAGLGPENRFWSAAIAVSMVAATICKHLGLLDYDPKTLQTYLVDQVLRTNLSGSGELQIDTMSLVTDYVYQNWGRILQIKSTVDRRGNHKNGLDDLVVPEQMPRSTDMIGRYETDMRRLFLIVKPFKEWLSEQQINFTSVLDDLKGTHNAKRAKVRMSKGTAMNLPAADVIEMQMDLEGPGDGGQSA